MIDTNLLKQKLYMNSTISIKEATLRGNLFIEVKNIFNQK